MATSLFGFNVTNYQPSNPIGTVGKKGVIQQTINFFRQLLAATVSQPIVVAAEYDQVLAQDNVAVAATGSGAQKLTINNVDATASGGWVSTTNALATALVTSVNTTATDPAITKALTAKRVFLPATGTFTLSDATPGTVTPAVGGTNVPFTATGVNEADALLLAAAINAQGVAGIKVKAVAAGAVVNIMARDGAAWSFTLVGTAGTFYANIGGIVCSAPYLSSITATAGVLAADINAKCGHLGHATSAVGVVTFVSKGNTEPIVVTGTAAAAVGGLVSVATSGDTTVLINGILTTQAFVSSVTVTAAALAAQLNANRTRLNITQATSVVGDVSVWRECSADDTLAISASHSGATSNTLAVVSTAGTLYGGIPGNAIGLTEVANEVIASNTTILGGLTSVALTAKVPGFPGNWITVTKTGDALTVLTARPIGGTATQRTLTFPG